MDYRYDTNHIIVEMLADDTATNMHDYRLELWVCKESDDEYPPVHEWVLTPPHRSPTITLKDRTQLCAHETETTIHNKIQAAKKHNKNTINVTVILNYNNTMQATTFKVNTKKISQIDTQGE